MQLYWYAGLRLERECSRDSPAVLTARLQREPLVRCSPLRSRPCSQLTFTVASTLMVAEAAGFLMMSTLIHHALRRFGYARVGLFCIHDGVADSCEVPRCWSVSTSSRLSHDSAASTLRAASGCVFSDWHAAFQ